MFGLVILLALVFSYLAKIFPDTFLAHLNFITRKETLLPLGAFIASALVGLLDDWFNITRQGGGKGGGLTVKHRLFIYALIAIFGSWWFYAKLDFDVIRIPFLGLIHLGWSFIPFFIFIIIATAGLFLFENSLSISLFILFKVSPERNIPACPITPDSLNIGISVEDPKNDLNIPPHTKSYTNEKDFSKYCDKININ